MALLSRISRIARPLFALTCLLVPHSDAFAELILTEVARGSSWVSPYWGYNTPKLVSSGENFFTVGIWGDTPETAYGVVYVFERGAWRAGCRLNDIYQPPSVLLDPEGRLITAYTRQERPPVFLRSPMPGEGDRLDPLPSPPGTDSAYYLGAAVRDATLYIAYSVYPSYSLFLRRLDLDSLEWSPPVLVSEGQALHPPKTAWVYPILTPDPRGVHLIASNCPDGSAGNTYNQIWHLYRPDHCGEPQPPGLVAESPVGSNAYAMDTALDPDGTVHVVHMWNVHVYGPPLPEDAVDPGLYVSRRDPVSGLWSQDRLGPAAMGAGFHQGRDGLSVLAPHAGAIAQWRLERTTGRWSAAENLPFVGAIPAGPSFMDVLSRAGGGYVFDSPSMVADGLLATGERVLWAVLPCRKVYPDGPRERSAPE